MLNDQTFEFSQACLKLKKSLRFTMRENAGGTEYLIEDEVTGRFFRVGLAQYTFMSMLDGKRTVNVALMKTATLLRQNAIDESEAASLCKWAIESGLVESENGNSAARRLEQHDLLRKRKMMSWLNPLMMRVPLFNPDRIVNVASQYFGWLVSPVGLFIWLVVVGYGFIQLGQHWADFYSNRISSFGSVDLLWIGTTWLLLKGVHELAHSVVCKRFGGRVHKCGVLILLLIPLPYVDVTSSWRFQNKWKRILVSAAGMMSEVFIAAIACCIWVSSEPGPLQYHAGNVIITATLHTLLFNINPLMRFDGYYMLADYLEIPNLATHGRQWLKGFFKRLYFGNKPAPVKETGLHGLVVRIYGVLAMLWFFLIAVTLSLAASSLIEGVGLMVAVIGCIMWAGLPLFMLLKYFLVGTKTEKPNRLWFVVAAGLTCLVVAGFLNFAPAPSVISAPVVVDYEPISIVRANVRGFANEIHVSDGDFVEQGDLLLTLENKDLKFELSSLKLDIEISELRSDHLLSQGEISQSQLENESLASMVKRKAELESRIADLQIFASCSGQVIARELDLMEGQYLEPGKEILSIGTPGKVHAIGLAKQTDAEWIIDNPESDVELQLWGRYESRCLPGKIKHIDPRARDDLPHEAFAASIGGPLAVVPRQQVESGSSGEGEDLMLTAPRVSIEVAFETEDQLPHAGKTGVLLVRNRHQNMGQYLVAGFKRFVRENNFRTHGL